MSEEQVICPECKKPCGPVRPGAKVYHMTCLMSRMNSLRFMWTLDAYNRETRFDLFVTCAKCKCLVSELDETHLCTWCASLEEEC